MRDWTDRFLAKIRDTEGGCWEWTGARTSKGYGSFWLDGRMQYAHRVAYESMRTPIPDGLVIDHLCRNRACVNPGHLEPVTNRTNILRGVSFCATRARQTRCVHGHAFTAANTYRAPNGTRKCRTCRNTTSRRSRVRGRGVTCAAA
ncbi:HNH endonuclease signature motif containing protein [Streptomyces sp. NPDC057301]|uniref:HNH endonuclease signature motif containing protein n=1 Tax=Streptomyces sp. NPDC057301 TaxID=3346093 RepID=UPI003634E88C